MTEKGKYLPLIVYATDPLHIVVIDNALIGFSDYGSQEHYPYKAFQVVEQLITDPRTQKDIPEKFLKYLVQKEVMKNKHEGSEGYSWLIGEHEEGWCHECLHVEVEITDEEDQPVTMKDFTLVYTEPSQQKAELTRIEKKVKITGKEAFHLFANICVTAVLTPFEFYLIKNKYKTFKPEIIREEIKERYSKDATEYGGYSKKIQLFAVEYLEYLGEELQQKKITPEEVLWGSGMRLLVFLINEPIIYQYVQKVMKALGENHQQLTYNQKLLYYSLIRISVGSYEFGKEANNFFTKKRKVIEQIEKELWKEFPIRDGRIKEFKPK